MLKPYGCLPNLVVIGAQKCGTSSLHYYLGQHPQIWMSKDKELRFFVAEHNWPRGPDWYRSHFVTSADVRGESSPQYSDYPRLSGVPARMHRLIPNARLIYLLRDPVDRILSHYIHSYAIRNEHDSLSDALMMSAGDNPYLNRSRYHVQLLQYLAFYEQKDILIVASEDLRDRRDATLADVFRFLGVDANFTSPNFRRLKHQSSEKRRLSWRGRALHDVSYKHMNPLSPAVQRLLTRWLEYPLSRPFARPELAGDLRAWLQEELRPDVERLRALTGRGFPEWSI